MDQYRSGDWRSWTWGILMPSKYFKLWLGKDFPLQSTEFGTLHNNTKRQAWPFGCGFGNLEGQFWCRKKRNFQAFHHVFLTRREGRGSWLRAEGRGLHSCCPFVALLSLHPWGRCYLNVCRGWRRDRQLNAFMGEHCKTSKQQCVSMVFFEAQGRIMLLVTFPISLYRDCTAGKRVSPESYEQDGEK